MTGHEVSVPPRSLVEHSTEQPAPERPPQSEVQQLLGTSPTLPDLQSATGDHEREEHDESNSSRGASSSSVGLSVCLSSA